MPNTLDFATWGFSNVQLAPAKLKLDFGQNTTTGSIAAETAARIAADAVLQAQITALQQPVYAPQMLLGGM